VLPGTAYTVDLNAACNLELRETTAKDGAVSLQLEALARRLRALLVAPL